ncbi:lipid A deacylase LpxR family protein [Dyadobacter psychrotolerans]|uniref:Lipid A deacylase LpxR family protein n=2 Tax=Dyadobacter psychrotolerans TaxID=2541721 RepID=A0A4V2Z3K2_9BACT|nr:lipid A deacylase LpxR family protein [Dyadobacter psychrotolerans]
MYKTPILIFFLLLPTFPSFAQRSDNTASFRNVTGDKYFRIHYDNDFFTKTDYYYTQGYSLEMVHPFLSKNPVSKILLQLKNSRSKSGLAFEHYGFTPTSIKSNDILKADRPFAGVIMLKSFSISVDTIRRQRLASTLSLGMIGPAAFAGRMQATIHRWTEDPQPLGWQYQIRNNPVINYELAHEKELVNVPDILSVNTNVQARLGTLSDKVMAGLSLTLGRFDSSFGKREKNHKRNFRIYVYSQPMAGLVGYDASLQGGFLSRKSPYTVKSTDINRITFQNNFGVVVNVWKIYAEYYQIYLSKEFKTGRDHQWGGVKFGVAF